MWKWIFIILAFVGAGVADSRAIRLEKRVAAIETYLQAQGYRPPILEEPK
jgi:hypothetical protein